MLTLLRALFQTAVLAMLVKALGRFFPILTRFLRLVFGR